MQSIIIINIIIINIIIIIVPVEDKVDITLWQVWSQSCLDISDEINYGAISWPVDGPKKGWSINDSDICITSIPSGDFNLEWLLQCGLGFTNSHSILSKHGSWDCCQLIGQDILHMNITVTRQECDDPWIDGI